MVNSTSCLAQGVCGSHHEKFNFMPYQLLHCRPQDRRSSQLPKLYNSLLLTIPPLTPNPPKTSGAGFPEKITPLRGNLAPNWVGWVKKRPTIRFTNNLNRFITSLFASIPQLFPYYNNYQLNFARQTLPKRNNISLRKLVVSCYSQSSKEFLPEKGLEDKRGAKYLYSQCISR